MIANQVFPCRFLHDQLVFWKGNFPTCKPLQMKKTKNKKQKNREDFRILYSKLVVKIDRLLSLQHFKMILFFLFSDPSQGLLDLFSPLLFFYNFFPGKINNLLVMKPYTLPLHKACVLLLSSCPRGFLELPFLQSTIQCYMHFRPFSLLKLRVTQWLFIFSLNFLQHIYSCIPHTHTHHIFTLAVKVPCQLLDEFWWQCKNCVVWHIASFWCTKAKFMWMLRVHRICC